MTKIKSIKAREILDSRGNPTVETAVTLADGASGTASVPSGASTGVHEAWELRDHDPKRYGGQGVLTAIGHVNGELANVLVGTEADPAAIDAAMIALDGTPNKQRLGANAILSVSLAVARAAAQSAGLELYDFINQAYKFKRSARRLPIPSFNIFNGGKHADTNLDFQEFMVMPVCQTSFAERVRIGAEVFHELGRVLKEGGYDTDVGNEGGYAPDIASSVQAIEFIIAAITRAGYAPGKDVGFGIDVGSSELYDPKTKRYIFKLDNATFTAETLQGLYYEWFRKYPIISIEDGLAEDDWEGWRALTAELGNELLLIGDDLYVTNAARLRRGIKERAGNAVLIKPNQVGTLTETIDCIKLAQKHGYKTMVSHRSGETTDDFIADLAVAVGADYIKSGSLSRGERLCKYNRLMAIESSLLKTK